MDTTNLLRDVTTISVAFWLWYYLVINQHTFLIAPRKIIYYVFGIVWTKLPLINISIYKGEKIII